MPTGYTADVADGTVTELKPFALRCARALGALISMRDDSWDAPIPQQFEISTSYHDAEIAGYHKEIADLEAMTEDDKKTAFETYYNEELERHERHENKKKEELSRYRSMLQKVQEWEGAPEGIKEFMMQQLIDSIEWDCKARDFHVTESDPEEWYQRELSYAKRSLERSIKDREDLITRGADRNKWLAQLHASLN